MSHLKRSRFPLQKSAYSISRTGSRHDEKFEMHMRSPFWEIVEVEEEEGVGALERERERKRDRQRERWFHEGVRALFV